MKGNLSLLPSQPNLAEGKSWQYQNHGTVDVGPQDDVLQAHAGHQAETAGGGLWPARFGYLHGWHFATSLLQCSAPFMVKNHFLMFRGHLMCFSLRSLALVLSPGSTEFPASHCLPSGIHTFIQIPSELPPSQAKQPLLIWKMLQALITVTALHQPRSSECPHSSSVYAVEASRSQLTWPGTTALIAVGTDISPGGRWLHNSATVKAPRVLVGVNRVSLC